MLSELGQRFGSKKEHSPSGSCVYRGWKVEDRGEEGTGGAGEDQSDLNL